MTLTVTLDKAGRVVLPKAMRDELNLEAGDALRLDCEGDRVTMQAIRSASPLRKEQGVWIFRGSKKLTAELTDRVLLNLRDARDLSQSSGE